MSEFLSALQVFETFVKEKTQSLLSTFDRMSFQMLVDCLKSNDLQAVTEAIEQLKREKKPLAIPPLFLVWKAHSNPIIKQRAADALKSIVPAKEFQVLEERHDLKEALFDLIKQHGHYRI